MVNTLEKETTETKILTREEILKADVLAVQKVHVPEWGGWVCIKEMTGSERDAFESGIVSMRGTTPEVRLKDARAKLLVNVICDASGKRLFGPGDLEIVGKLGAKKIDLLFEVASKLNGLSQKDVKELVEDLEPARNGVSTSV